MPFAAHFLNVGRGSCTVLEHPSGRRSMIDINIATKLPEDERVELAKSLRLSEAASREAALTDPVRWWWERFGTHGELFRYILSHPDSDHLLGVGHLIAGQIPTAFFWDPPHNKICDAYKSDLEKQHWEMYLAWRAGQIAGPTSLFPWPGTDTFYFGSAPEFDHIEILWPTPERIQQSLNNGDWNNASMVLRVTHAGRRILLPGDIEGPTWQALAAAHEAGVIDLRSDVLLAPHHGRRSGYPGAAILQKIAPLIVIVSTDRLPAEHDALPNYRRQVPHTYSTRRQGDLAVVVDDNGALAAWGRDGLLCSFLGRGFGQGFAG
jgi:hypothetical protein